MKAPILPCATILTLALGALHAAYGGSATWSMNPTSADWNTAANWTPPIVPNGPNDVATFDVSSVTSLRFSAATTEVAEIVFNPGASSFNMTADSRLAQTSVTLTISGVGITNDSGVTQNVTAGPSLAGAGGTIEFLNTATAGDGTALSALGQARDGAFDGSEIDFYGTSTAGAASILAAGATGRDDAGGGEVVFWDNATAADASFTVTGAVRLGGGGGEVLFFDASTAANATFTIEDGTNGGLWGEVRFFNRSDAANAQFTVLGGEVSFFGTSSAADATFTLEGGGVHFDAFDENKPTAANGLFMINNGSVTFSGGTAGNATLIANSETNDGGGATINFFEDDESDARIQLFGKATLTVFFHSSGNGEVTVGSVEGDGLIVLSTNQKLIIGNNDLSTIFSGTIQDFGSGSLGKVGTGTLTLTGANTYAGGTTIEGGTLLVQTKNASATGTGPVQVNGGTLGGRGKMSDAVTIGSGTGTGAFLAPGVNGAAGLTTQGSLTFNSDGIYSCEVDTSRAKADKITARGVTINSGALFSFVALGNQTLAQGTVFTVINNRSPNPITGTFSNLPDGSTFTVGSNTFQASYSGGDGNDLTLTVAP